MLCLYFPAEKMWFKVKLKKKIKIKQDSEKNMLEIFYFAYRTTQMPLLKNLNS